MPAPSPEPVSDPRDLAGPDSRFAEIGGVSVHHRVHGEGEVDAVFLHHFFGSTRSWRHIQEGLSERIRSVAFDRPGFGLTERPRREDWNGENPYTRSFSVDLTLGLMDRYGMEKATLVAASAGGTIALETYRRAPERVGAMVLLSPAIGGDVGPPAFLRPLLRTRPMRLAGEWLVRQRSTPVEPQRVGRSWYDASRAEPEDAETYNRPMRLEGWPRGLWEVMNAQGSPNLWPFLREIDVPVLVVVGEQDSVISPRWNRRAARRLPHGELEVIPDCGHVPHEERPDEVVAAIRDFLPETPTVE